MYKAAEIAHKLMQKGWSPYIPHFSMVMYMHIRDKFGINLPWEQWMQLDSSFINVAHAFYFIGHSKGADRELEWATNKGLPIYLSIDQVPKVDPDLGLLKPEELEKIFKVAKIMTNNLISVHCPGCSLKIFEVKGQLDGFLCEVCDCIWEIIKHEIAMGDKIDLE